MSISIYSSFLPHSDPDASLAFYRDTLGFEVRNDVGYNGMRWITVGPADQPGTSIVLFPPAASPGVTDEERQTIFEPGSISLPVFGRISSPCLPTAHSMNRPPVASAISPLVFVGSPPSSCFRRARA